MLTLTFFNQQGRKEVTVHVTDINDNVPEFTPPTMTVILTEGNSTAGIHVIQVNATDKDDGDNKLITYSISGGNLGDVFQIDGDTVRYTKIQNRLQKDSIINVSRVCKTKTDLLNPTVSNSFIPYRFP